MTTRQTSIEAFHKIREEGLLSNRRWEVYQHVYINGPCSARDTYKALCKNGLTNPGSYLTRFAELRDMGVLSEVGRKVDPDTKMTVIIWDVTKKLPQKLVKKKKVKCNVCKGRGYHLEPTQSKMF